MLFGDLYSCLFIWKSLLDDIMSPKPFDTDVVSLRAVLICAYFPSSPSKPATRSAPEPMKPKIFSDTSKFLAVRVNTAPVCAFGNLGISGAPPSVAGVGFGAVSNPNASYLAFTLATSESVFARLRSSL